MATVKVATYQNQVKIIPQDKKEEKGMIKEKKYTTCRLKKSSQVKVYW